MQGQLFGGLIETAIARIRDFEPPEGYYLAFSGGKDSVVLKWLARQAGVKYDAHYNWTTCDPPELVRFVRQEHPDVAFDVPEKTMWELIRKKGLPSRTRRWCCELLKETGGRGRRLLTGIRWAESARRRVRHGLITIWRDGANIKRMVNPIIDWDDADVWRCIRAQQISYCSLYDEGWKRLGCVLCPMSHNAGREAARWSGLAAAWRASFRRYFESRTQLQQRWSSADAFFDQWLQRDGDLHTGDLAEDEDCELFAGAGNE